MILNDKQLSTKQQMIDKIYECIADKTLSLWCFYFSEITRKKETYDWSVWTNYIRKVIWHPVMIGDVLGWLWQKDIPFVIYEWWITERWIVILKIDNWREEKRKPIEDQSDECITFIYNLLPQWS